MKYFMGAGLLFLAAYLQAQSHLPDSLPKPVAPIITNYDTVYIAALRSSSFENIPFSMSQLGRNIQLKRPLPQLMQQLSLLPSVSSILGKNGKAISRLPYLGIVWAATWMPASGRRGSPCIMR